jgi:uncharacterized protein YqjF (DUF2071 family)
MIQRWETLTFLHWRYDPAAVQRALPEGLEVETADGTAWVGLVPFLMRVALPRGPWLFTFCETNVRTYVQDAAGRSGIWFFSLDAADLPAVVTARTTYRLPYFWSRMTLARDLAARSVTYTCARRWPGPVHPRSRVTVHVGDLRSPSDLAPLDHFLTARWLLFSVVGPRRRFARAWHPDWPLHQARAAAVDDGLVEAAGLPRPEGEPLVHFSPGVDVRIGRPQRSHRR